MDIGAVTIPETASTPLMPSRREDAAYGIGCFGLDMFWQGAALYLLYYYTDIVGIAPIVAGMLFAVGLVWGAMSDILAGIWLGRRATSGRDYRVILKRANAVLALSFLAMFGIEEVPQELILPLALVTHCAFRSSHSVAFVTYCTLMARLGRNQRHLDRLATYRVLSGLAGGTLVAVIVLPLAASVGDASRSGFPATMAAIATVAALVATLPTLSRTRNDGPERSLPVLWRCFGSILLSSDIRQLAGSLAIGGAGLGAASGLLIYIATALAARPEQVGLCLGATILSLALGTLLWAHVSKWMSATHLWLAGSALAASSVSALPLLPALDVWQLCAVASTMCIGIAAYPYLLWSRLPAFAKRQGYFPEPALFGVVVFAQKVGIGVGMLLTGAALGHVGYVSELGMTSAQLGTLKVFMTVSALVGLGVATLLILESNFLRTSESSPLSSCTGGV